MNDAAFSPCNQYRYWLYRQLIVDHPQRILWVMLNPSTADCTVNDPTIKNCMAFSNAWGFGHMDVVNLFAYRATKPTELNVRGRDIGGVDNDRWILERAARADVVLCAWGANRHAPKRAATVVNQLLRPFMPLFCLGVCDNGQPWHPLYRPHHLKPTEWKLPNE